MTSYFDLDTTSQPDTDFDPASISPLTERLLQSGVVTDRTTFDQLESILAQDANEQSTVQNIKRWFDGFDPDSYSAEDGNLAVDLLCCWQSLDSIDFAETLGINATMPDCLD